MAKRLASIEESAKYLGIGERTLRRWIADGEIPAYRVGKKFLRVDLNEVDEKLLRPVPNAKTA